MKGRFPVDLFVIIFGPLFLIAIALLVGSAFFSISQGSHRAMIVFAMAAAAVVLLSVFFFWRRYRRSRHT